MSSRLIEGVTRRINGSGQFYTIKYYCATDSDLAELEPQKGDVASWAPVPANISDIDVVPLIPNSAPYLLVLSASPQASGGDSLGRLDRSNFANCQVRSYDSSEVLLKQEWFGVTKTKEKDTKAKILTLDNVACVEAGQWKFLDATASSVGKCDMSLSPYKSRNLTASEVKSLIDSKQTVLVHTEEYYRKRNLKSLLKTSFGKCSPKGPGSWRTTGQNLTEVLDSEGKTWAKILETYEQAPKGFIFK